MTAPLVQGLYDSSSVALQALGQLYIDEKGRKFRYAKAGALALVTGHILQAPAEDTNFSNLAVAAAAAIGATSVVVTLGGTAVTENLFEGGVLYVKSSTGLGQSFDIVSHSVQTSTTGSLTVKLDRPLKVALTTSSKVTLRKSPYNGVIDNPTTQTANVVGAAMHALAAGYYGWIQSGGDIPLLFDTGTNTSDAVTGIGPSAAVAGSVKPQNGGEGAVIHGYAREVVSTDSTFGLCHLTID